MALDIVWRPMMEVVSAAVRSTSSFSFWIKNPKNYWICKCVAVPQPETSKAFLDITEPYTSLYGHEMYLLSSSQKPAGIILEPFKQSEQIYVMNRTAFK